MIRFTRNAALAAATGWILIAVIGTAHAAGAFAVGACGAYGYGYDFHKIADARAAAMKQCAGASCKVVGSIKRGCAAFAIDAKQPCGSFGWAVNSHLGKAENASLRRCFEFGGHDCVVRAWACDEKG
ncbi:MAG: DUF4189 domain-containing protein [Xanthobacteraceae bacterium]|nr:DUF4189 domain-containing protein [Xanthobacteraceae bacterium]